MPLSLIQCCCLSGSVLRYSRRVFGSTESIKGAWSNPIVRPQLFKTMSLGSLRGRNFGKGLAAVAIPMRHWSDFWGHVMVKQSSSSWVAWPTYIPANCLDCPHRGPFYVTRSAQIGYRIGSGCRSKCYLCEHGILSLLSYVFVIQPIHIYQQAS